MYIVYQVFFNLCHDSRPLAMSWAVLNPLRPRLWVPWTGPSTIALTPAPKPIKPLSLARGDLDSTLWTSFRNLGDLGWSWVILGESWRSPATCVTTSYYFYHLSNLPLSLSTGREPLTRGTVSFTATSFWLSLCGKWLGSILLPIPKWQLALAHAHHPAAELSTRFHARNGVAVHSTTHLWCCSALGPQS